MARPSGRAVAPAHGTGRFPRFIGKDLRFRKLKTVGERGDAGATPVRVR